MSWFRVLSAVMLCITASICSTRLCSNGLFYGLVVSIQSETEAWTVLSQYAEPAVQAVDLSSPYCCFGDGDMHFCGQLWACCVQELTTDELCQVLVTPKNALTRQYAKQFNMSQTQLHMTSKAMQAIAAIAKDKGTGARGLRSIMERLLMDAMFDVG